MVNAYTIFHIKGVDKVKGLHVTHKYFGAVSLKELKEILVCLQTYFDEKPFEVFGDDFSARDLFGTNKDIPVLKATWPEKFFPKLRKALDEVKETPHFRGFYPHISVNHPGPLHAIFDDYYLIQNGEIIWSAVKGFIS